MSKLLKLDVDDTLRACCIMAYDFSVFDYYSRFAETLTHTLSLISSFPYIPFLCVKSEETIARECHNQRSQHISGTKGKSKHKDKNSLKTADPFIVRTHARLNTYIGFYVDAEESLRHIKTETFQNSNLALNLNC